MIRSIHQDPGPPFDTVKSGPETTAKIRKYDILDQQSFRKSFQDLPVRFVTAESWPKKTAQIWQYELLRPNMIQKITKSREYDKSEPDRAGS